MDSLHTKADSVRAAVSSTATCTPATASILSEILLSPINAKDTKPPPKSVKNAKTPAPKVKATKAPAAKARGRKVVEQEDIEEHVESLSTKERSILATEVINATLKALTEAIKAPPSAQKQACSKDRAKSSVRHALRRSSSVPQSPLGSRSLNRVSSSPSLSTRKSRSSSSASITSCGNRSTAECTRTAFACLRSLQASKAAGVDFPALQLENGMSVLIGKLIALGLDDLAIKEVRILKRRLDPDDPSVSKKATTTGKVAISAPIIQGLGELLDFGPSVATGPRLGMIITTQLQILRLMTSSRKNRNIEAALNVLQPSHPSSPTKLLLQAAKDPKQANKIARQLQSLSELLLSLTPSISSSEDTAALEPRIGVAPENALQLQTLALQNRILWWKLAGHKGDPVKELLDPFFRCLSAFARRSQCSVRVTYATSKQAFLSLKEALSDSQNDPSIAPKIFAGIYRLLGSLSQDAKLVSEAISWTENVQALLDPKCDSDAKRCAVVARLVALKLLGSSDHSEIEEELLALLDGLEHPFKGEASEIEEVMSEVSLVRRAAISLLAKRNTSETSAPNSMDGVRQMCESLIFLCPRLCLRYLGKTPDSASATKDIVRYEQRRMFIAKLGVHAIDSALFLIKLHISEGRLEWDLMDSLLQDCLSLLDRVDASSKDADRDDGASSVSYYVRISNLYSTHYLNLRRDAQNSKDIQQQQRTLRRSIDAVRLRPQQERRSALLPTKLEKMAEIHKTTGRYDELFKTLLNLRDEMINQQVLSVIASAAATHPIPRAWNVNDDASLLARTMNSLFKVLLKYGFSVADMPILEDSWSTEEKGAMLEKQLDIIFGQSNHSHTAVALRNKLIRALVDVYEGNQYPIRRLRVYTRILSLELSDRKEIIDESKDPFNYTAVQDLDLNGSKDEGLRRYLPHLNTLAASSVQLHQDHPNMDVLKDCLVVWSSCLGECKSLEALEGKVDDVPGLLAHLKSMADYIEMKGCGTTRIVVLRLISEINELFVNMPGPDSLILSYKDLGLQWLHLGYSGKAGLVLDKAQSYSNQNGVMPQTLLELHLSYAEYLMAIGSLDKCEEHLKQAHAAACENGGILSDVDQKTTLQRRTRRNQLLANAFLLHSMLALDRGAPQVALGHAKQSVRLLRRAWANLENQMRKRPSHSKNVDNSDIEKITEECSDLSLSQVSAQTSESDTHSTLVGSSFWSLISPLFRSISFLSEIYAHNGMFQETLHYAEQAQKLVQEINSNAFLAIAYGAVGATWLRAGRLDKASEVLTEAKKLCALDEKSRHTVNIACHLGELYGLLGEREAEIQAYEEAESALASITASDLINSMDRMTEPVDTLEVQMSQLAITKTKAKITRKTTTARAKVIVKRKTVAKVKAPTQSGPTIAEACPQLASLKAAVFRQKAKAIMISKGCEEALSLLEQADNYCSTQNDVVYQGISMAKQLLLQSLEQMTADPVYSVLQDSTISYPSIAGLSKAEKAADRLSLTRQSPPSKNLNVPVNSRSRSKSPTPGSFFDKLRQAQDHLIAIHSNAVKSAPVSIVHIISALLNSVAILLSAAGPVKGKSLGHPGFATCSIETARTIAIRREHKAVQTDQQGHKIEHPSWPIPAQASDSRRISLGIPSYDMSRFQRDYIDIIPSSWTAISISLSDNRQELSITKFQAGHSPFVLRLPLGRNTSIDADEEVFGFEQGHSELMEIIDSANQSAHSARDMTTKDAREAWWEEREALDARLKDLLENIDKVWLGGFKGIFSQDARRPDLLARFQRSFQTILDKHLPSRQKNGKKSKGPRTALDTRILDLFIGLGDASAEDCDLDEPLTDLLYFVVDILQFHGELNAYAEIDFDSIVIEIHDALRCYHEAVQTMGNDESRHTILILDKALHAFPWESLPCMEGLAVSRLPSMGCLRDRIINQQQTMSEDDTEKQYINRDNGSFILNPEGDLKSTQATFQKDLLGLKGWDGVIKREPSESEIKRQLESKDLFLYFGHGSGAQYIRAREIRRTENCAVTFLMGCSSGALVDAKEFEPYGPPINYMHAGCPALVATLWDITDKDIDRFAKSTFEYWGLFGSEQGAIGKGKGRKKAEPISDRKLSVVEAVTKGREACNLRYLNAAAVCVYGVPVYLK